MIRLKFILLSVVSSHLSILKPFLQRKFASNCHCVSNGHDVRSTGGHYYKYPTLHCRPSYGSRLARFFNTDNCGQWSSKWCLASSRRMSTTEHLANKFWTHYRKELYIILKQRQKCVTPRTKLRASLTDSSHQRRESLAKFVATGTCIMGSVPNFANTNHRISTT